MSISSTGLGELGPLVVKPKVAWKMLGCSNTRGYELIAAGELEHVPPRLNQGDSRGAKDGRVYRH